VRWHVYILECTASTGRVTVHVGISIDVGRRVRQHKHGEVKQTRGRRVGLLGYSEAMGKGDALRKEAALKKLKPGPKRAQAEQWGI
jgi:predicted GIY-YIG superfamily endonuclease